MMRFSSRSELLRRCFCGLCDIAALVRRRKKDWFYFFYEYDCYFSVFSFLLLLDCV